MARCLLAQRGAHSTEDNCRYYSLADTKLNLTGVPRWRGGGVQILTCTQSGTRENLFLAVRLQLVLLM